ncbi:MAG: creatininase family protein [Nocardioidaceae bacterium]
MSERLLLGELSWVDIVTRSDAMPLVVLPVGSVEQHGPHLPLLVDSIVVEALAVEAARRTGVVVAPTVMYSSSQGHGSVYPGTLALKPGTVHSVLVELGQWLASAGFRKVFILNGHLGNAGVLWTAVDDLIAALNPDVSVCGRSWWDLSPALWDTVTSDTQSARSEFHANWAETAMMLHLRPDLVRMDRAVDQDERPWEFTYGMIRKSSSGSIGRGVSRATAEEGSRLFDDAVRILAEVLARMLAEHPPPEPPVDVRAWRLAAARQFDGHPEGEL